MQIGGACHTNWWDFSQGIPTRERDTFVKVRISSTTKYKSLVYFCVLWKYHEHGWLELLWFILLSGFESFEENSAEYICEYICRCIIYQWFLAFCKGRASPNFSWFSSGNYLLGLFACLLVECACRLCWKNCFLSNLGGLLLSSAMPLLLFVCFLGCFFSICWLCCSSIVSLDVSFGSCNCFLVGVVCFACVVVACWHLAVWKSNLKRQKQKRQTFVTYTSCAIQLCLLQLVHVWSQTVSLLF